MKISQEVREFARLNHSPLEGEGDSAKLSGVRGLNPPSAHPEPVEGLPLLGAEEKDRASTTSARAELEEAEAEAGMAQMSQHYREGGNHLYIGAGGREHD
jgi:hypothetical protein